MPVGSPDSRTPSTDAGATEDVRDGLIAGLAHALSNRISTISVIGQTIEMGDAEPDAMAQTIAQEVARLEEILRLMRLVSAEGRRDPVHVPDLARDLAALARHHRELRGVEISIEGDANVMPVLADRPLLLQALLSVLVSVARSGSRALTLRYDGTPTQVRFVAAGEGATADPSSLRSSAERAGAAVTADARAVVLSIDSLPEARRKAAAEE